MPPLGSFFRLVEMPPEAARQLIADMQVYHVAQIALPSRSRCDLISHWIDPAFTSRKSRGQPSK